MRSAICPTYLHFHELARHFLALNAGDRFLRFGWVMTDVDIVAYVESLLQSIGNVFLVVEPVPDVSGVLHMKMASGGAEVGLSVSSWARGKGIGGLLLERARLLAGARGARTLFVRNLNFNAALRRLAHHIGMQVACTRSGRSTLLEVPPASPSSAPHGVRPGRITLADYSLHSQWSAMAAAPSSASALPESMPV